MSALDPSRPLLGLTVGLSAAQSEDATDPGFHSDELNRSVTRIAQRLLAAGARIVTGHDWRRGGIMDVLLHSPAIEHAASIGSPEACAIVNLAPDSLEMAPVSMEIEEYAEAGVLRVERSGMPEWWEEVAKGLPVEHRETARSAVAMLHLREHMERLCDARICIGGKTRGFSGFYPGILEEGWRTARSGKPLYVTAMLGGASRLMAQASGWSAAEKPADFAMSFRPVEARAAVHALLTSKLTDSQRTVLPAEDLLPELVGDDLPVRAGLTKDEWKLLIEAPTADAVGVMAIRGLAKFKRKMASDAP